MGVTAVGALITAIGVVGLVAALTIAHTVNSGLNPVRDPVSQYGITRHRRLYLAAAEAAAVAGVGAIVVLLALVGSRATLPVAFLAVFSVARAVIPFVPMDAPGEPVTATGRWHNILAFLAFAGVTIAAFLAGAGLHDGGFPEAATWSTVFAVVMAIGSAGVLVNRAVPAIRRIFGLVERVIYLGFIAWFVLLAIVGFSA
jgi:hypothetical protein